MKFVVSVSNLVHLALNVQVEESKRVIFHEHLRDLVFDLDLVVVVSSLDRFALNV